MKLDYLPDGSDQCPLVRLYDFTHEEKVLLCSAILSLKSGKQECVPVHELPGVESIGECRLTLRAAPKCKGMIRQAGIASFECVLTPYEWGNIFLKAKEIKREGTYQWLEAGDANWLFSKNGDW